MSYEQVDHWLTMTEEAMSRVMGYRRGVQSSSDLSYEGGLREFGERPPPNVAAFRNADRVRLAAARLGFAPDRVGPDVEGGVYLGFDGQTSWVTCTCDNDGDIVVLFDRAITGPSAEQVAVGQLPEMMERVRRYIRGDGLVERSSPADAAFPPDDVWRKTHRVGVKAGKGVLVVLLNPELDDVTVQLSYDGGGQMVLFPKEKWEEFVGRLVS